MSIETQILGSSFYENLAYAKELHRSGSYKALAQRNATEQIRKDWITSQLKDKANEKTIISHVPNLIGEPSNQSSTS